MSAGAAQNALEYAAVRTLGGVARALPRSWALALGGAVGQLGWWTRVRRRRVLDNLAIALPDASLPERRRIAARSARNFGRTVVEYLRFAGLDSKRILEHLEIGGLPSLNEALAEGRGAIVVTAHLSAWGLYSAALPQLGIEAALMIGAQRNQRVDAIVHGLAGGEVEKIAKGKLAPRAVLRALAAGKAVVIAADHYSSDQTLYVPFLGRDAYTIPLPAALVDRRRTPLFCLSGHRGADGRHRAEIEPIELPSEGTKDIRREVAIRCNQAIGEAILRCPEHYFWYHDRWKVRFRGRTSTGSVGRAAPDGG